MFMEKIKKINKMIKKNSNQKNEDQDWIKKITRDKI